MFMKFETERFELIKSGKVLINDYQFGHGELGELDVWIDSSDKGNRFLRKIISQGSASTIFSGVYTKKCYILREKSTGKYYFLDMNDSGIWLFTDSFFGTEDYHLDESQKIGQWLAAAG
jgi:hypothetical protein